jgi:hypothetical protein
MLKKLTILTLVCLVVSLWPGQSPGMRADDLRSRHVSGLARAAILVITVRVREGGRPLHVAKANGFSSHSATVVTGPPHAPNGATFYILPSHRVATHLSI